MPFTVAMSRSIVADPGSWGYCCGGSVRRQRQFALHQRGVNVGKVERRARVPLRSTDVEADEGDDDEFDDADDLMDGVHDEGGPLLPLCSMNAPRE